MHTYVEGGLPALGAELDGLHRPLDGRIVHQAVDRAEDAVNLVDDGGALVRIAHVPCDDLADAARILDQLLRALEAALEDVVPLGQRPRGDDHIRALGRLRARASLKPEPEPEPERAEGETEQTEEAGAKGGTRWSRGSRSKMERSSRSRRRKPAQREGAEKDAPQCFALTKSAAISAPMPRLPPVIRQHLPSSLPILKLLVSESGHSVLSTATT